MALCKKPALLVAATLALGGLGCTTSAKRRSQPAAAELSFDEPKQRHAPVRDENVMNEQADPDDNERVATTAAPQKMKATKVSIVTPAPSAAEVQSCKALVDHFVPALRALYQLRPGAIATAPGQAASPMDRAVAVQPSACSDLSRRRDTVQLITDAITGTSGKIGVILPLTGADSQLATYVVSGLRAAFQGAGLSFETSVILKDSGGTPRGAEIRLAELVLQDRVGLVIGGLSHSEAQSLAQWSAQLLLPTLLLNRDRDLASLSKMAFMVYPDEKRLADTLADAALKRGIRRVAILKPDTHKSDKVVAYFRKAMIAGGAQVVYDLAYTPNTFESMQGVSRQIFKADAADRGGEYKEAYWKARMQAKAEGVAFDPRSVLLKPVVDFDAVFIPDDFRTVRHFAKLFKYHMVDHLVMIGDHEWRSPALIDPYDNYLDNSFFADFIGSYSELPAAIANQAGGSPLFIPPQNVVPVDFQMVGYRAGRVARAASEGTKGNRRVLGTALATLSGQAAGFGPSRTTFDDSRHSAWPTYVFTVSNRTLLMAPGGTTSAVSTACTGKHAVSPADEAALLLANVQ